MTVIATDTGKRLSNLVKYEEEPTLGYCREVVTVNEAALASYVVGTCLGKVTATGKYKISVQSAADGSETVAAIVIGDSAGVAHSFSVAATTDTKVLVLARGPVIVSKDALVLDASYDLPAEKQAAYDALAARGIVTSPTI